METKNLVLNHVIIKKLEIIQIYDDSSSLKEMIEDNNIIFDNNNDIIRLIDNLDINNNNSLE